MTGGKRKDKITIQLIMNFWSWPEMFCLHFPKRSSEKIKSAASPSMFFFSFHKDMDRSHWAHIMTEWFKEAWSGFATAQTRCAEELVQKPTLDTSFDDAETKTQGKSTIKALKTKCLKCVILNTNDSYHPNHKYPKHEDYTFSFLCIFCHFIVDFFFVFSFTFFVVYL